MDSSVVCAPVKDGIDDHDLPEPGSAAALPDPLLLNARQAAALCNISPATWHRLSASGKNPAPVSINAAVRWRRSDIERWVELGCPDRAAFKSLLTDESRSRSLKGRRR